MPDPLSFSDALQKFWGYSEFRPGQEAIVRSIAAGHDTCVVMPTGGGKSLCYQLPAAMDSSRTAIVISPLIALMQDQVAQLTQMGIPAALLNSTQRWAGRQKTMVDAARGSFRLVYLSPEMAVQESSLAWLKQVPISFFAIDEAHCISEWGHEFRPEYRQLSRLRSLFPDTPVSAFTASATQHVRHDIVEQLHLRDAFCHVASFRRTNLRYRVRLCDSESQETLLLDAVRAASTGSVIVYVPTIARVAETVAFLGQNAIPSIGYHGKMDPAGRRSNQEKWMLDEPRVIVATVAFGLGINKSSVRAVIHLALPKSVEQFYQEAGRAGRDGLPSDCYLFWQKGDAAIHNFFINQIVDPGEQSRARLRYNEIRSFVESDSCRHHLICTHFGERSSLSRCSSCDNCLGLWRPAISPKISVERKSRERNRLSRSTRYTLQLLQAGKSFEEIAQTRGFSVRTITEHASRLVEAGKCAYRHEWIPRQHFHQIEHACHKLGFERLKPLKDALPDEITYDEIRIAVAGLRASSW